MNIAFLGNFRPRTALGEPFSTESHLAATYELLGHQVLRLQEDETDKRTIPALCHAGGVALFHWVDTWHSDYPGGFWMLDELRRLGIPSVGYTLDLFVGLPRETLLDVDPWFRCDFYFSADGGHPDVWAAKGINHHWMPPAVFAPECYLAEPDPALVQDIIFVGSYGYHPQWPYRQQLIDWLKVTYGSRFTHYDHSSGMRGHRLNQLYASARVVIGDSCCPGFIQRDYWSDRVPETLGRGGYLIHPWISGMEAHFRSDRHFVGYRFGDFVYLQRLIEEALIGPQWRLAVRLAGHEHVKTHHTYTNRLQAMLEIVALSEGVR
jgi:hypothetical protein